ncbi:MAG TPA: HNH endonuclease [Defluviitaleaceae bacterium]|nr:HNH endonuclease [Defluviitaleaceae bacterium]
MLTWQEARRYHNNQKGIHQRGGQILSICASFSGEKRKYHDELLSEDLMIYIGEGDLTQPQSDTYGNLALKKAKETGAIFPVIAKWDENQYEYLGKWQVIDWEYSPLHGFPAHYRFLLRRIEPPETEARKAKEIICSQGNLHPQKVSYVTERILRDTRVIQELKVLYNYTCQVCNIPLNRGIGDPIVEGHHIMPLGKPHNGPDIPENVVILCPNHHALFDMGVITIDVAQRRVIHIDPNDSLNGSVLVLKHTINEEFVNYHNKYIFKGLRW